jgi:hypothetical protein
VLRAPRRAQELARLAVAPTLAACSALVRPHLVGFRARLPRLAGRDDDQRGARFRARFNRATTLYPVGPRTRTMMQSCASAAKLRSGGPILPIGIKAKGQCRVPPPRTVIGARHKRTDKAETFGVPSASSVLLCRTQNDAVRHNALPHKPPQGDQKLARQGHDHGLASTASLLGASSKPLR